MVKFRWMLIRYFLLSKQFKCPFGRVELVFHETSEIVLYPAGDVCNVAIYVPSEVGINYYFMMETEKSSKLHGVLYKYIYPWVVEYERSIK